MKSLPILFVALLITATGCIEPKSVSPKNESLEGTEDSNKECFKVSYITGICGQAILKIENPSFFKFGETWKDHANVFYTVFDCYVDEIKLRNAPFFVTISESNPNPNTNCAMCLAVLDYQGSKKYFVSIVTECNGSSGE